MSTCRHDSLGRRIYQTSQTIRHHIDQLLKPFDITMEQLHIVKRIELQEDITQREICTLAAKSPANITRLLDRLEKKKLIVRRDNPDDRRSQLVSLTGDGRELASGIASLFSALSGSIEKNIAEKEIAVVVKVLDQIEMNILELSEKSGD